MPEKRVARGAVIGLVLGVIAIGAFAIAATREKKPPTPPPVTQFAYVSSVKRAPANSFDYFSVDVQNTGEVAGICTLECMEKHKVEGDYTDWQITATISHTLAPGEIRTFGDNNEFPVWTTGAPEHEKWYVSFRGEPGEILKSGSAW